MSSSALPYKRSAPSWLKTTPTEVWCLAAFNSVMRVCLSTAACAGFDRSCCDLPVAAVCRWSLKCVIVAYSSWLLMCSCTSRHRWSTRW
jgi:hypothetical protein